MKLLPLKMPEKIEILERANNYGKFFLSPLERGFGITIGNALRRVLLSSIQGSAISAVKIDGVLHEFSTIPGVYEDVPEIILNLKRVRIKLLNKLEKKFLLSIKKKGIVKASNIKIDNTCKIINPDQLILTVTDDIKPFNIELTVTSGRGYVPSEFLKKDDAPIGTIFIDAFYSPVTKVNYKVGNTRIEKRTDYDTLTLEVWTDGGISPEYAVGLSALILKEHINLFENLRREEKIERIKEIDEKEKEFRKILAIKISDLELSVRASNCLKNAKIETLGDLVKKTEAEMLEYPNFGRKSLAELVDLLKKYGLSFGMSLLKGNKREK
ncbi:MAG: DNA-directed RNA polymerase subunit alpha [bacterium]|nr:DNA-directed RNA polymerase subunit alpha [bacterium]